MAYFCSSNYDQYHDNHQYYQPYTYDSYDQSRYVQYYSDHIQHNHNSYVLAPTQPLVGYYYNNNDNHPYFHASKSANFHENGDYFYDPVSTQFVVSYSTAGSANNEANDLEFEDYNPEPFHGGYDIGETYGHALPPSSDICYPPSIIDTNLNVPLALGDSSIYKGVPSPYGKEGENSEGEAKPKEGNVIDSEEGDEDEEYEEEDEEENLIDSEEDVDKYEGIVQNIEGESKPTNGNVVSQVIHKENSSEIEDDTEAEEEEEEEENRGNFDDSKARNEDNDGKEIRRQIPPGYGIEAMDLCDCLFGGYFPCLLKRNRGANCHQCGNEVMVKMDDNEVWQGTVDYLFGNPNPYGGAMPEKGSYGDPMYSYQRHYPQQSINGQIEFGENETSSWLHSAGYNNGHNGDYYH